MRGLTDIKEWRRIPHISRYEDITMNHVTTSNSVVSILISACLVGEHVRYNGSNAFYECNALVQLKEQGHLLPFCPEVSVGMSIPRRSLEIVGGDGDDVLQGNAQVVDIQGNDVTHDMIQGAENTLKFAQLHGVNVAILKDGSPSCGVTCIYDGTFSGIKKPGKGVVTTYLEQHGIHVFSEKHIERMRKYLET